MFSNLEIVPISTAALLLLPPDPRVPAPIIVAGIAHFEVASGFAFGHSKGEKGVADGSPKFHVL